MSPDNWKGNPVVAKLIKTQAGILEALPSLGKLMIGDDGSFRGLTVFLGDTAEFVVGVRTFGDDGSPMVLWSSGGTMLEALINTDRAVASGNFKVDKKALENGR